MKTDKPLDQKKKKNTSHLQTDFEKHQPLEI
jgi:hypothetical protein